MMARDRVLGRSNPWADLFDPGRTQDPRRAVGLPAARTRTIPYYLVRDRFAGAEGRSLRRCARGEGKILELDGERVAAYRDDDRRGDLPVAGVHAHGVPGRLERRGADVGLPLPRLAVRAEGKGPGGARRDSAP